MRRAARIRIGCSDGNTAIGGAASIRLSCPRLAGSPITRCTSILSRSTTLLPTAGGCDFRKMARASASALPVFGQGEPFPYPYEKLKDPHPLVRLFDRAKHLGPHLGPVLYQLPPHWPVDLDRLRNFLQDLRSVWPDRIHAMGFATQAVRRPVLALLDRYQVTLCLHDMKGSATDRIAIGPFVYVRFHGVEQCGGGACGDYQLGRVGDWLAARAASGVDVYAYFNNDIGGRPRDALRLRQRLQRRLAA